MPDNPIQTAAEELKKWIDLVRDMIEKEQARQAKAAAQKLETDRHNEHMAKLDKLNEKLDKLEKNTNALAEKANSPDQEQIQGRPRSVNSASPPKPDSAQIQGRPRSVNSASPPKPDSAQIQGRPRSVNSASPPKPDSAQTPAALGVGDAGENPAESAAKVAMEAQDLESVGHAAESLSADLAEAGIDAPNPPGSLGKVAAAMKKGVDKLGAKAESIKGTVGEALGFAKDGGKWVRENGQKLFESLKQGVSSLGPK